MAKFLQSVKHGDTSCLGSFIINYEPVWRAIKNEARQTALPQSQRVHLHAGYKRSFPTSVNSAEGFGGSGRHSKQLHAQVHLKC